MFFIGFFSTPLPYIILMCFYMWGGLLYMTHPTSSATDSEHTSCVSELRERDVEIFELPDFDPPESLGATEARLLHRLSSKRPHAPPGVLLMEFDFILLPRPPPSKVF